MDDTTQSEAEALWQDTLDLLAERDIGEATLAMLRSCTAEDISAGELRISTKARFVQKEVAKIADVVGECLSSAAFQPMTLSVSLVAATPAAERPQQAESITRGELISWSEAHEPHVAAPVATVPDPEPRRAQNPLVESITTHDSRLTFEKFIIGDENIFAYQAALAVAEGVTRSYNPLFIHGKSGLGKTHLLRAVQNYVSQNDPSRVCVYKDASSFKDDYVSAMRAVDKNRDSDAPGRLTQSYQDVDLLIIDDVQKLLGAAKTIDFFFDTFNYLISNGKQIVLAADRTPAQLGMGKDGLDERITSRMDSGFTTSIQVPSYELKLRLIHAFYDRMKEDARVNHVPSLSGTVTEDDRKFMASRAGTNIRTIEGFVQACIFQATRREQLGEALTHDDIERIAKDKWPSGKKTITIPQIQTAIEKYFDISHEDLVGSKRNKEVRDPRHIAIWLSRELTETPLAGIGERFGGRTHATVISSLRKVERGMKENKVFHDQVIQVRDSIIGDL